MRCRHALSFEMYPPEYPSVRGMTLKPAHAAEPSPSLSLSLSPTPLTHLNPLCPRMVDPILGRTLLCRCIAFFRRSANQREPWSTTPFPFSLGRFTQTSCFAQVRTHGRCRSDSNPPFTSSTLLPLYLLSRPHLSTSSSSHAAVYRSPPPTPLSHHVPSCTDRLQTTRRRPLTRPRSSLPPLLFPSVLSAPLESVTTRL